MIKTVSFVLAALLLGGSLVAYVRSETNDAAQTLNSQGVITPRTRALISGENAYVLGMPEMITDISSAEKPIIAPDGGAVLISGYKARPYRGATLADPMITNQGEQNFPELEQVAQRFPELQLVYWDTRTRVAQTLFRESIPEGKVAAIVDTLWFPKTRVALINVVRSNKGSQTGTRTLMRVDTATGTVTRLADLDTNDIAMSPTEPMAFVYRDPIKGENGQPDTPPAIRIYTPQGSRPWIQLPEDLIYPRWTSDGKAIFGTKTTVATVDGKRIVRAEYTLLNIETGQITHPEKRPAIAPVPFAPAGGERWKIGYSQGKLPIPDLPGKAQTIPTLWLHTEEAPATPATASSAKVSPEPLDTVTTKALLVATNAKPTTFLYGQNTAAILFLREGTLCAAPIFRVPFEEFTQTLRQVQRKTTMENAKQIALSLLMYSADYDDTLPLANKGLNDNISPYLKDASSFNNASSGEAGFTYTYTGTTATSQIQAPATTQLGTLDGAGGQAIIWADGHVTWIDNPAKPK